MAALLGMALGVVVADEATGSTDPLELTHYLPDGAAIEARIDADLTGDGKPDVACVARNDEARVLMVLARYTVAAAPGQRAYDGLEPIGSVALEAPPLGAAALRVRKGVLVVEDLTGGTTATATTYRYRFDRAETRMRLIGLDAERYSRTNSHDALKLSWNLLTGTQDVVRGSLKSPGAGDDTAYRYSKPDRTVQKSMPVYMDATPSPDRLLDAEIIPQDEDRD